MKISGFASFDAAVDASDYWPTVVSGDGAFWSSQNGAVTAYSQGVGQSFATDMMSDHAVIGTAKETVRGTLYASTTATLSEALFRLRATLEQIGQGYLELEVDPGVTYRYAEARYTGISWQFSPDNIFHVDVVINFDRTSPWRSSATTWDEKTVTATTATQNLTYGGWARTQNIIFTLTPLDNSTPMTQPVTVTNSVTGMTFTYTRSFTVTTERARINCQAGTCEYSSDSGATWSDDGANLTIPATQDGIMDLVPQSAGAQDMDITCAGTPNFKLKTEWYTEF